jgi:hypothetical protein
LAKEARARRVLDHARDTDDEADLSLTRDELRETDASRITHHASRITHHDSSA